jgi:stearoyl-CoA desaturase (delta-9 desaturase)
MKVISAVVKAAGLPLVHLIPLTLFWTGTTRRDWAVFAISYLLAMVAVGGGLHRYFAHKSFRTSRAFQFLLAGMAGCFFGDAIEFSAKHRWHHRNSDNESDFNSPRRGIWQCWFGHIVENPMTEPEMLRITPDLTCFPELMWLHRFWFAPGIATVALILALGGYRMFACAYCLGFLAGLHGAASIGYFCHTGRRRNFETRDKSSNSMILAILLLGEGWHNNHHYYPAAARSGIAWYEIDILYWLLKGLSWSGVIWSVREIPQSVKLARRKRAGETACALR